MLIPLLLIALVLAASSLALRLYMGRAAEDALHPGERIDIAALRDPLPQNSFLACPPNYCAATAEPSPTFALSVDRVAELWSEVIGKEQGVVEIETDPAVRRTVYVQHTPILRFPDIVTVEFVSLAPGRSSVAIYSRSRYGRGDFGTNRKRVMRLLNRLSQMAG